MKFLKYIKMFEYVRNNNVNLFLKWTIKRGGAANVRQYFALCRRRVRIYHILLLNAIELKKQKSFFLQDYKIRNDILQNQPTLEIVGLFFCCKLANKNFLVIYLSI